MSIKARGDELVAQVSARLGSPETRQRRSLDGETAVGAIVGGASASLRERVASLETQLTEARQREQDAEQRAEKAESVVRSGALVERVDPARVRHSEYADRDKAAFRGQAFEDFCDLIRSTNGNTEAGKVRPLRDDPDHDFELIAGHRRHAACLATGCLFKCEIEVVDDDQLVDLMHIENQGRLNLSAFEKGLSYARLLSKKRFSSGREMAAKYRVKPSVMQRLLRFADLPQEMVEAYGDPRLIRVNWVDGLIKAFEKDPDAVRAEVQKLQGKDHGMTATQLFHRLTGKSERRQIIASKGVKVGSIRMIHDCPAIVLFKDAPTELIDRITSVLSEWMATHGEGSS